MVMGVFNEGSVEFKDGMSISSKKFAIFEF